MLPYTLRCRKNTESKIPKITKTKIKKKTMPLLKCAVCVIVKNQYLPRTRS